MEKERKMREFVCEYCKRDFSKELALINHICEKKRRWFQKDEQHARIAYAAWNRFYELNSFDKKTDFRNNYHNFINSNYYTAFIKFGMHVRDINAIDPAKFIDYVIKNNLPLDKWSHELVYEQYVREVTRQESAEEALERNLKLITDWSTQNNENWVEFFRKVNTNQAVAWIKEGRLSPWLLYNAESAIDFLDRCTPEQVGIIKKYAPTGPWKIKFNKNAESCEFIKTTLKQNGM